LSIADFRLARAMVITPVTFLSSLFPPFAVYCPPMSHIKTRLFGLLLIITGAGLVYYNWQQLWSKGEYSMKLASFGPLIAIGGLFLVLVPTAAGKPETTKQKLLVMLVFVIGLAAGLVNWFLMDPGFFGK
jgi:hypothetical protein